MTGGSIINNTAINGDGGGIFTISHSAATNLPSGAYGNLDIGLDVIFSGNRAINRGASAPPNNRPPHIAFASSSIGNCVLNNYDINYTGRLGQLLHTELSLNIDSDTSHDENDSDENYPDYESDSPSYQDESEDPSSDYESDSSTSEFEEESSDPDYDHITNEDEPDDLSTETEFD